MSYRKSMPKKKKRTSFIMFVDRTCIKILKNWLLSWIVLYMSVHPTAWLLSCHCLLFWRIMCEPALITPYVINETSAAPISTSDRYMTVRLA